MKNETHSNDDRAREIFSEGVKFDEKNNMYISPLPFNGKEEFLKTNEAVARVRTRNQHRQMCREPKYLTDGIEVFKKMVEQQAVERVNSDEKIGRYYIFSHGDLW